MEGWCLFPGVYSSPVVHLNNADTTNDSPRHAIKPNGINDGHPLIQDDVLGGVDEIEHAVHVAHLPDHLLVRVFEIGSRSAHQEGKLCTVAGEREEHRLWRSNYAENL